MSDMDNHLPFEEDSDFLPSLERWVPRDDSPQFDPDQALAVRSRVLGLVEPDDPRKAEMVLLAEHHRAMLQAAFRGTEFTCELADSYSDFLDMNKNSTVGEHHYLLLSPRTPDIVGLLSYWQRRCVVMYVFWLPDGPVDPRLAFALREAGFTAHSVQPPRWCREYCDNLRAVVLYLMASDQGLRLVPRYA